MPSWHISRKAAPVAVGLDGPIPPLSLEILWSCAVLTSWNLTPPPLSPQLPVGPAKDNLFWVKSDVLT